MKLAIVILNYNTYEMTLKMVDSLFKVVSRETEIVVVDNKSSNESSAVLKNASEEKNFTFIQSEVNGGYAKGNNIGITYSQKQNAEYVLVANNDILIDTPEVLDSLVKFMDSNPKVGAVSPRLLERDGRKSPPIYYKKPNFWDLSFGMISYRKKRFKQDDLGTYRVYAPRGSFMLLRNSSLMKIGNLDERTFLYYEEPILAERLAKEGFECWHYGDAVVTHLGSETIDNHITKGKKLDSLCGSYRHYLKNYRGFSKVQVWICEKIRRLVASRH